MLKNYFLKASLFLSILTFIAGCKSSGTQGSGEITVSADDATETINNAKKIFYSLPSPIETAMIIKTAGATYDEKLLNPLENVSNYTTNRSMALNLGIYTTDLSFASLFEQTQTTINYMSNAKKLAEGLGILDAIDNNTIKKLEENINNKEVIMDIISETFMASSSFLKENDRAAVASVVLVGGWLEGLYIATQLINADKLEGNPLARRIVDQKLSLEIVLKLLNEYKDDKDVAAVMGDMDKLSKIFDKIEIKSSGNEVKEDKANNITKIESETKIIMTTETFKELSSRVKELRAEYIK